MKKKHNKNKKGFTLAEVLITLTIIGIIAGMLFPSILANYTERTLKAKRQALVARMSQAMGELANQFGKYEDFTCGNVSDSNTCEDNGSAIKFISEGLASTYKLSAVCDSDGLSSCDFPSTIALADGTDFSFSNSDKFANYNPQIQIDSSKLQVNTKSAAFMTKNGESVLLFFNPRCAAKTYDGTSFYTEGKTCVNMIYDLNGAKKKPNKMGEDIGFISVFYSDAPYVVSPKPINPDDFFEYDTTTNSTGDEVLINQEYNFAQAKEVCTNISENAGLPTVEEAMSLQLNAPIIRDLTKQKLQSYTWTSSLCSPDEPYLAIIQNYKATPAPMDGQTLYVYCPNGGQGRGKTKHPSSNDNYVARCVYKD